MRSAEIFSREGSAIPWRWEAVGCVLVLLGCPLVLVGSRACRDGHMRYGIAMGIVGALLIQVGFLLLLSVLYAAPLDGGRYATDDGGRRAQAHSRTDSMDSREGKDEAERSSLPALRNSELGSRSASGWAPGPPSGFAGYQRRYLPMRRDDLSGLWVLHACQRLRVRNPHARSVYRRNRREGRCKITKRPLRRIRSSLRNRDERSIMS